MRKIVGAFALFGALAGCSEDPVGPVVVPCATFLESFTVAQGDTVQAVLGVRYIDIEVGTGASVQRGDFVNVNYSGYKTSGEEFDSSCGRQALTVLVGAGGVIPGFEIGMTGMRFQGVRRVFLPAAQAYPAGSILSNGNPHPLAGLDLIFDIQLVTEL
jgi:peptidylprolyl isomerase